MAHAGLSAVVLSACALFSGCGTSPCGLKLQQHLFLPSPAGSSSQSQQRDIALPCCGASVFRDIDLSAVDVEVDLSNPNVSGVDGFLTGGACDTLFSGSYEPGSGGAALCQVYIGPVRPRAVSERKKVARGRYRIFAQGYSSSDAPLRVSLDLGVWSSACVWNPLSP